MTKYDLFLKTDIYDLEQMVINRILEMNPHMVLGERMTDYFAQVRHGAHYAKPSSKDIALTHEEIGCFVPHIAALQPEQIRAGSVTLTADDTTFEVFRNLQGKYLHPRCLTFPYEKLLRNYKAGDTVSATDENYEVSPFTFTQEFLDERAHLTFSFATSNGTPEVSEETNID